MLRKKLEKPGKRKRSTLKKFLIFFQKKFFSNFGMTADQAVKHKFFGTLSYLRLLIKWNIKAIFILWVDF